MVRALLIAALLTTSPTCIEAFGEMGLCYILDGILILYGIVLTVLYCRLRMSPANKMPDKQPEKPSTEGAIYMGLTPRNVDIYETIKNG